uniref:histidine kinase n=1 Tax=Chromera velia CCMP2878 TaxID=1169474 RepID=A0A0G4H3R8_9ALVE|eukprot:Cvel_24589.t1-p1 / transcript=Cvel_24589.t1 / gene=Cvel_24589 / organism=Chromera_velia_CCMP2878 / gene_product=Histidine kinase 5, putative / transcript_product=Histidine kinase 5, putative / location=Cvel_scaffold2677:7875-10616(-) / protein_length=914 / sequence_SO=supercontig / SO=protein_coding / is_pseudo=false
MMNLRLPDGHLFWLGVMDISLWWLAGVVRSRELESQAGEIISIFSIGAVLQFFMARFLQQLPIRTMSESDLDKEKETKQRVSAETARDIFLSYIMHEMRNPLSGASLLVYEFSESLKELARATKDRRISLEGLRGLTKKEALRLRQLALFMGSQVEKMRGVCDDILQLEKIQKGKFEYEFVPTLIEDWVMNVATQATPQFSQIGGRTQSNQPKHLRPPSVQFSWNLLVAPDVQSLLSSLPVGVADFVRLEQVIGNFLSNAKKFTQKGFVRLHFDIRKLSEQEKEHTQLLQTKQGIAAVALEEREEDEDENRGKQMHCQRKLAWIVLRVCVTDSGAGLSEEDRGKLFRPYAQVRAGELQNGGGTGLGLCICKSFVEAHTGGQVGVESEGRGKGSTFFFQIFVPLLDSEHAPVHDEISPNSETSVAITSRSAERKPSILSLPISSERRATILSVTDESSGSKTAALLRERAGGRSHKAEFRSRTEPAIIQHPPVAFAPLPEPDTPSETSDQDCRSVSALALPREESGTASREAETDAADILLVDDDRFCLMAGSAAIQRLGFSVRTAPDGHDACRIVIDQKAHFRFILVDKHMGRMDGPEAVARIVAHFKRAAEEQENPEEVHPLPPFIIGCTADVAAESKCEFIEAGADRVIVKPLEPLQLAQTLRELEQSREQTVKVVTTPVAVEKKEEKEGNAGKEEMNEKIEKQGNRKNPSADSEEEPQRPSPPEDDEETPKDFPSLPQPMKMATPLRELSPSDEEPLGADVLLVDDDRFCLVAGSAVVRRLGFSVRTVEDGEDACDLIISQNASFRIVLMDKNMARMEGPDAIRKICAHFAAMQGDSHSEVPADESEASVKKKKSPHSQEAKTKPLIIGYTGDAGTEAEEVFMEAGADRVIFKPLDTRQLTEALQQLDQRS